MRNVLALIFGMILATGAAFAGSDKSFDELDKDGDGSLSQSEIQSTDMDISGADTDGDGKVSKSEYKEATGMAEDDGAATDN